MPRREASPLKIPPIHQNPPCSFVALDQQIVVPVGGFQTLLHLLPCMCQSKLDEHTLDQNLRQTSNPPVITVLADTFHLDFHIYNHTGRLLHIRQSHQDRPLRHIVVLVQHPSDPDQFALYGKLCSLEELAHHRRQLLRCMTTPPECRLVQAMEFRQNLQVIFVRETPPPTPATRGWRRKPRVTRQMVEQGIQPPIEAEEGGSPISRILRLDPQYNQVSSQAEAQARSEREQEALAHLQHLVEKGQAAQQHLETQIDAERQKQNELHLQMQTEREGRRRLQQDLDDIRKAEADAIRRREEIELENQRLRQMLDETQRHTDDEVNQLRRSTETLSAEVDRLRTQERLLADERVRIQSESEEQLTRILEEEEMKRSRAVQMVSREHATEHTKQHLEHRQHIERYEHDLEEQRAATQTLRDQLQELSETRAAMEQALAEEREKFLAQEGVLAVTRASEVKERTRHTKLKEQLRQEKERVRLLLQSQQAERASSVSAIETSQAELAAELQKEKALRVEAQRQAIEDRSREREEFQHARELFMQQEEERMKMYQAQLEQSKLDQEKLMQTMHPAEEVDQLRTRLRVVQELAHQQQQRAERAERQIQEAWCHTTNSGYTGTSLDDTSEDVSVEQLMESAGYDPQAVENTRAELKGKLERFEAKIKDRQNLSAEQPHRPKPPPHHKRSRSAERHLPKIGSRRGP